MHWNLETKSTKSKWCNPQQKRTQACRDQPKGVGHVINNTKDQIMQVDENKFMHISHLICTLHCFLLLYLKFEDARVNQGAAGVNKNLHAGSPLLQSHWDQFLCMPKSGELTVILVMCNSLLSGWKEDRGSTIRPSGKGNVQQAQSTSRLTITSQAMLTKVLILTSRWVNGAQILSVTDRTTRHQNTLLARHACQWWKEMKSCHACNKYFQTECMPSCLDWVPKCIADAFYLALP